MIISFAKIIVLLRKRHLSVLQAGECRHKMTWRIPVPLSFLACRGIVRRFLVRLCKSNNIFLNCQIIRTKNDHERSAMPLRLRRTVTGNLHQERHHPRYDYACHPIHQDPYIFPSAKVQINGQEAKRFSDFFERQYHLLRESVREDVS